ncbi:helix-turn-helix domain-containing protein [Sphingomonas sp. NPDC079357]|uniref:helix-turn-helix domain-containing protein n=1 Tax=Sphingomonas sp. NPDC079357 TaxID=3364518 RepID=UPI00384C49B4
MVFHAGQAGMTDIQDYLLDVGVRLRSERDRIGLNQADFGRAGGINRSSQAEYEGGKRACTASYLGQLREIGVDVGFVLTGARSTAQVEADAAEFVELSPRLNDDEKAALLLLARSIAHRNAKPPATAKPPIALPPIEALERGFLGVLAASQHMDEGALAHELAKRLPTMLGVLQGPLTIERDREEDAGTPPTARSERQRA